MSKTIAIIQARLGSTRLPGKVLEEIIGLPMIQHVVERTQRAISIDEVVIATTDQCQDLELIKFCQNKNWPFFAGSEHDVLDRYFRCARQHSASNIVRITSDCPLISPKLIDQVVKLKRESNVDYTCNFYPERTFPRGLDVECFSMETLAKVHQFATKPELREHVTLMIYRHPELFELQGCQNTDDLSDWRWTVDTAEDLKLVRTVFEHFQSNEFTWLEASKAFQEHPTWKTINQHVDQKVA